ncbi:MAG TPA: hypothetical protein ENO08_06360 [Candidatus Eisenbacteria bacterium]|uniref:Uncharacterized protein n=1 Tax=Eiseniibacteriota bacterium TaxID=2212470 RepID=A0A7V2AVJ6_UNCEI|nr:hypothetical protein [Candidatus Eisenbacteria bacterium]
MRRAILQVTACVLVSIFASGIALAANPDHIGGYEQTRDRDGRMLNIKENYEGTKQGVEDATYEGDGILSDLIRWFIGVGDKVRHRNSYQNSNDWNYYYDGRYKPEKDD